MKKIKNKYDFIALIKERKITSYSSVGFHTLDAHAMNSQIDLGEGFCISVQASSGHYCSPRKTFKDLNQYSEFEILISHNNQCVVFIDEYMHLSDYECYEDIEYVGEGVYFIEEGCPVAGYVP